jgi:hypothetical protein
MSVHVRKRGGRIWRNAPILNRADKKAAVCRRRNAIRLSPAVGARMRTALQLISPNADGRVGWHQ